MSNGRAGGGVLAQAMRPRRIHRGRPGRPRSSVEGGALDADACAAQPTAAAPGRAQPTHRIALASNDPSGPVSVAPASSAASAARRLLSSTASHSLPCKSCGVGQCGGEVLGVCFQLGMRVLHASWGTHCRELRGRLLCTSKRLRRVGQQCAPLCAQDGALVHAQGTAHSPRTPAPACQTRGCGPHRPTPARCPCHAAPASCRTGATRRTPC